MDEKEKQSTPQQNTPEQSTPQQCRPQIALNNERTAPHASSALPPTPDRPPPPHSDVTTNRVSPAPGTSSSKASEAGITEITNFQCYVNENYVESPNIGKAVVLGRLGGKKYVAFLPWHRNSGKHSNSTYAGYSG